MPLPNSKYKNLLYFEELLYIGEADYLPVRLNKNHEKYQEWLDYLKKEEEEISLDLLFTVAKLDEKVTDEEREQAEAALIYYHYNRYKLGFKLKYGLKLPYNVQNKESFNYDPVRIITSGCNRFLNNEFTVIG